MPFSNIFGISFMLHLLIVLFDVAVRLVYRVLMTSIRMVRMVRNRKYADFPETSTPNFFPGDKLLLITPDRKR